MNERTTTDAVFELCLAFPQVEHKKSHSMNSFRVNDRVFAYYVLNHHGDQRIAVWVKLPEGAQEFHLEGDEDHYFLPPYVGHKGWLGLDLTDGSLEWDEVQYQVTEAYLHTSGRTDPNEDINPLIDPPTKLVELADLNPFNDSYCASCLERIRELCFALPETHEVSQFGQPAFKAGKKTFASAYVVKREPCCEVWVGVENQPVLTTDPQFRVPRYTGHHGWIQLGLGDKKALDLLENLILNSYKHFALRRMLKSLEEL